ncbi:hypothetical protein F4819DRAFT_484464 [Hypoxylon fuscum]|nr:hypothetical protein F4819DRAFT_484464 [Hypoxylon fuscum]
MSGQTGGNAEPSSVATSTAISTASSTSPGLSTSILAIIGVTAVFCALGLGALAVFLLRRKIKQRKVTKNEHFIGMPPAQYPGFQLQRGYTQKNTSSPACTTKTNAPKSYAAIAHASMPQELPAEPAAVELPAHWHWHQQRRRENHVFPYTFASFQDEGANNSRGPI